MDRLQEKTTAPYPPVGADGGQSLSQKPNQSIAEGVTEHKPPERDLEEILRQISRVNDPAYLPTVSMNDLYEQVYPGRPPVVDGLLYAGTYLFVGAPKVGKSFLMAQLAYHVSMGLSLWGYEVRQGTVLYLALEDNHRRLQERLYRMFGVESTGNLFFAIGAKQLGGGLEEQLARCFFIGKLSFLKLGTKKGRLISQTPRLAMAVFGFLSHMASRLSFQNIYLNRAEESSARENPQKQKKRGSQPEIDQAEIPAVFL